MKTALILASLVIVVLAAIIFIQWRTIQKLIPVTQEAGPGPSSADGSGRFGDMVKAVQDKLEPKEFTVKF